MYKKEKRKYKNTLMSDTESFNNSQRKEDSRKSKESDPSYKIPLP